MLIEFSVENHRVFREKQTFSMVAGATARRSGPEYVAHTGFPAIPYLLHTASLFGANGSGKSSLINAMAFMSYFVRNSFRNEPSQRIEVEPFLYHSEWRDKPSEFEAIFLHEETLYQYGFSLTHERVVEEWLFARPTSTGRQRTMLIRSFDDETGEYSWEINSVHLKGERGSWKSQTREDALFLSTSVYLGAEGDLKRVYDWFAIHLKARDLESPALAPFGCLRGGYTSGRLHEDGWSDGVKGFLRRSGIAIEDIDCKDNPVAPREDEGENKVGKGRRPEKSVYIVRSDEKDRRIPLNIDEESLGTKALFQLAGPILDSLDNGYTLVLDELNSVLHPLAFQHLISMFCDSEQNPKNAQLIFTTHDTSVMDSKCIGRDQIWLMEKKKDLAARLIPFSDFKTRRDSRSFQKGYLQGRYGAVPRIVA